MILILVLLPACNIASKSALEETRKDLSELAKAHQRLAESYEYFVYIVTEYSDFIPKETSDVVKQDAKNRVAEAKAIEIKITENSKKDVGFFNKDTFGYIVTQFWDVAKPIIVKTAKAVAEVASNQGGTIGLITGAIMTAYGVYQQVTKNSVVAKVKEEKEIEHEADKLIPAESHAEWDKAEKEAKVKVYSRKKGIS
mgnify:CR=1 FL=1